MMRLTLKWLGKTLAAFLLMLLLYAAAAFLLGHWRIKAQPLVSEKAVTLYLLSNGVHSDIVMPYHHAAFDWSRYATPQDTRLPDNHAAYIAIGWGDKGFYLNTPIWADLTAKTALKAISGFNETALHVRFLRETSNGSQSVAIRVSPEQYQQLARNIAADFRLHQGKTQVIDGAHYADNDAFYEAHGRYNLFNTCNTWSNRQLKQIGAGGVMWTPFAHDLLAAFQAP